MTVLGSDHLVTFDYAEPSPIMLFAQRWWRRTVTLLKVGVVVCAVAAYPIMTVASNRIDDSSIEVAGQNWTLPEVGVSIVKIARELEGGGWAGDRANWHPQARLTAMPAWQSATADALSQHTALLADLTVKDGEVDSDLKAAARLLKGVEGEDMRPRLTAAAEALNRYDSRAGRDLAATPDKVDKLAAEATLFASWAEADRIDLSVQVNQDVVEWPASKVDIETFYSAKARAHLAQQMLAAARTAEPRLARLPSVSTAFDRAELAWSRAARMKPLVVSNQSGDGPFMANHLASIGFYLGEAQDASRNLAAALEQMPEGALENVAGLETQLAAAP
ncbi:hypothetical protein [Hyphomonas sp.]|uniref:hypothetical protein n=1 Tax=Hyphomonas sp. TaxID=87 RepID=UPI003296DF7D